MQFQFFSTSLLYKSNFMKTAYIFPGQGSQFVGMGKDLYQNSGIARSVFDQANTILGFKISDMMFGGTDEDLRQTKVTQPAIFIHSVALAKSLGQSFKPDMVAGHSLGEFSALVAIGVMSFEDGLRLVAARANAMQKACELEPSTMAAVLMLFYIWFAKVKLKIKPARAIKFCLAGIIIALHWITFFGSIDEANIAIALTMFSTGAFFASLIEPIIYKRKIIYNRISILYPNQSLLLLPMHQL